MDDPKPRRIEIEAATLVPDRNPGSPSPAQDSKISQTPKSPFDPGQGFDAPTILEGALPPLAPVTGQKPPPDRDSPPPASTFGSPILPPGMVIGNRYQILQIVGEGGMGAVYKAKDLELNRVIALKVIRPELASNPEILQRFKQELILARQVTDRNVIRIFDLGEAAGIKFITMEYVEGQSLYQILKEKGKLDRKSVV